MASIIAREHIHNTDRYRFAQDDGHTPAKSLTETCTPDSIHVHVDSINVMVN